MAMAADANTWREYLSELTKDEKPPMIPRRRDNKLVFERKMVYRAVLAAERAVNTRRGMINA